MHAEEKMQASSVKLQVKSSCKMLLQNVWKECRSFRPKFKVVLVRCLKGNTDDTNENKNEFDTPRPIQRL